MFAKVHFKPIVLWLSIACSAMFALETVADDPVAGDPVAGDPVAGDPVAGDPVAGEPVAGEPVAGEPTKPNPLDRLNDAGFSPLHYLAMQGKVIEAIELISRGADVNVRQGTFQGTPLQYAANKGHVEIVRLLVKSDAEIDAHDTFGRTPLMWACQAGEPRVVKVLIDAGADVNAKAKGGWNPLMYARKATDSVVEKLLLDAGALERKALVPLSVVTETPPKMATPKFSSPRSITPQEHALYSAPVPFVSLKPGGSGESMKWSDVSATELDVNVDFDDITRGKSGSIVLPVTISNDTDSPLRVRLAHERHGGEWPPTDLYASVTPAGVDEMAKFAPVYRRGKSDVTEQTIRPGKRNKVTLRMDWPGTGSVPAEPMMSLENGVGYLVSIMLLFEVDGEKQYTVSKLKRVGSGGGVAGDPATLPTVKEAPLDEDEVARRLKRYRSEIDWLMIPRGALPRGYRVIRSLPAVVVPGASENDDAYFRVVSAFVAAESPARKRVEAAIVLGFTAPQPNSTPTQIGIYALCCGSEADAKLLKRPGLIRKGKMLVYIWKKDADSGSVEQVREYYAHKSGLGDTIE